MLNACQRKVKQIASWADRVWGAVTDWSGAGRKVFRAATSRGIDVIRSFGPPGAEIARQIETVARPAFARAGRQTREVTQALRGLNGQEREWAAKLLDEHVTLDEVPQGMREKVKAAEAKLRAVMDRDLGAFRFLGGERQLAPGVRRPARGSGQAFPTSPNQEGMRVLRDAVNNRRSGRLNAVLEWMVENGHAANEDEAMAALVDYSKNQLRGTNHYFERTRGVWDQLPPELREWDPLAVLPRQLERNAMLLEGIRKWGTEFEGLKNLLGRMARDSERGAMEQTQRFIESYFGNVHSAPGMERFFNPISNYETVSKLSGLFSPILNFGQRFTHTVRAPLRVQAQGVRDLPPLMNNWLKASKKIKAEIEEAGAISGMNPLTELTAQKGVGQKLSQMLLNPFIQVARGNEYMSAHVARLAIEADLEALLAYREAAPLGAIMQRLKILAADPELGLFSLQPGAALERRIASRGIDPDRALDLMKQGKRLTPEQLTAVMQRATEDEQFRLNILTDPIWWKDNPALRLAFKFKTFGVRTTEFIWKNVVKEAMLGNAAPLLKFMATSAIMGEVYHLSRDLLTGSDKSFTSAWLNTDPSERKPEQLAARIASNIVAQGGIGILADLNYGITGYLAGPAGSTVGNLGRAAQHIILDPDQAGLAVRELFTEEVVLARHSERLLSFAEEQATQQTDRLFRYHRTRNAAYAFEEAQERGGEFSVRDFLQEAGLRAIRGPVSYELTEKSLRYRYAARAVTAQEPEEAAGYLEGIFANAQSPREIEGMANSARRSMMRNAPMGNLSQDAQRSFLAQLPDGEAQEVRRLRAAWIRDYERALRTAQRNALRNLRR